jgi:hypothetical protein
MTSERQDTRPFRIVISVEDGRQVITPEGELDLLTVAQLDRRLIQAMPEGDTVIDLSKVSFIAARLPEAVASLDRSAHSPAASVPGA